MNRYEPVNMYRLKNVLTSYNEEGNRVWETIAASVYVRRDLRFWLPLLDTSADGINFYDEINKISHVEVVDLEQLRKEVMEKHTKFSSIMDRIKECECIPEILRSFVSGRIEFLSKKKK